MPHKRDPRFLDLFDVRRLTAPRSSGLDAPVQLGFLMLVLLVGVGSWMSYRHTKRLYESEAFVAHTREVIGQVREVLLRLVVAESSARGYAISGDESYLEPPSADDSVADALDDLAQFVQDNEAQQARIAALRTRVLARQAHLETIVEAGRKGDMAEAARAVRSGEGKRLMDEVRNAITQIEQSEEELLASREADALASYHFSQATGIGLGIAGLLLVVVVYNFVRRYDRLRAQTTRQLADARNRFEVALASIGDAVLVTDLEGRLVYCNAGCGPILGVSLDDIGKSLDSKVTMIAESTGYPIESVLQRALAQGGIHRVGTDASLRRADGTTIPVDITAAALSGEEGAAQGVILVVLDVSAQKERERELERSNERFRSLVLATSQVVWTADAKGYMRDDSPSWRRLTGQTYEQWHGHGWVDALHPDDRNRVLHGWLEAVAQRRPFPVEYRLRMADGSFRWSMSRAVPVTDTDGTIREWVGMNYDIQVRKEIEQAQRDANKRKDEFIALLAHELRNPLAPLRNGIEVLKTGAEADDSRAVEMMDRQVRHMVRLIDDLLDLSRITQGKLELRVERIDLREILRQALDSVRPAMEAKRQHSSLVLPSGPLWVDGDSVRLTQVVTNLLNNAIKYSGEDAHIWLTAEREGMRQLIIVRDTGQGIPTEMRSRIFDLFLQGDGRAERVEGGLGIGLTLVKRIVELHNGTVDVFSEGVGTGSEFTVRLPASSTKSVAERAPAAPVHPATRSLRILVIDDNEDSAESMSMLLRVGGHSVRTAFRGEAGLQECARFEPELVLCDIRMPDLSGYEVARRLRAHANGRKPLIVALTGFGTVADRESSSRAGFDLHVVKPVEPDVLAELLRAADERTRPK
jgi:two-component system CheB/CheR fusion protein